MGVSLDYHLLRNLCRARFGHATDVVAAQINQHQVLCNLLFITQEIRLLRFILLSGAPAFTSARDRSDGDLAALKTDQNLK